MSEAEHRSINLSRKIEEKDEPGRSPVVSSSPIYPMGVLDSQLNLLQRKKEQDTFPEFSDSSGPLFDMYREMAEEEDKKMAERWTKDADGIIIFVGPSLLLCHFTH
jgi:hypothetical protein